MKTLLLAILSLCSSLSVVALSQEASNQAPQKTPAAGSGRQRVRERAHAPHL